MKNIFILFIVLFSFKCFGQDPRLFDNSPWYLEKLTIDGADFVSPSTSLVGEVNFYPSTFDVGHSLCKDYLVDTPTSYSGLDVFTLDSEGIALIGGCATPDLDMFMSRHYSIYSLGNPNNYVIESIGSYLQLTITNIEGDIAIYNNVLLSNTDFLREQITVYPNPVKDRLKINTTVPVLTLGIHNIEGQEILQLQNESSDIDVSRLTPGLYFMKIETELGSVVKRVVKE